MSWDAIEGLLRAGQIAAARRRLRAAIDRRPARPDLVRAANLCRRAGLARLSLLLLGRWVRPPHRRPCEASDAEKAEYGAALLAVGADREALQLLGEVRSQSLPSLSLFRAFAHISSWDYAAAIPLLRDYVSRSSDSYQRRVGEVNLAASLVHERSSREAATLLKKILLQTQTEQNKRLHSNVLELLAQNAFEEGDMSGAQFHLEAAQRLLSDSAPLESLFVRKWRAILRLYASKKDAGRALSRVRNEARAHGEWEILRDCDYHEAVHRQREDLVARVYFGSPFKAYRARFIGDLGARGCLTIPKDYEWHLSKVRAGPRLDVATGRNSASGLVLKEGQLLQRFLEALSSDIYRPQSLASLHAALFVDRHFHPLSSPNVVHQALSRLRGWLASARLPLLIVKRDGFYRFDGSCRLSLRRTEEGIGQRLAASLAQLTKVPAPFSASEAASHWGVSLRSANRKISAALKAGHMTATGQGRARRYRRA